MTVLAITFLAPSRLWLLLPLAALGIAYLVLQTRRRHYAARFTNLDLLASVAPKHAGWRRHLSAAVVLLGLLALVLGVARPVRDEHVPRNEAVVMMVVDVSASMEATDVSPTRIQAAEEAASDFVKGVPPKFQVGLVAFDGVARVLTTPTRDHDGVVEALQNMQTGPGTAAGDGISTALDTIRTTLRRDNASGGKKPAATIVLISDGVTTTGKPLAEAAQEAKDQNVPVTTIAYGTADGQVTVQGEVVDVPSDPQTMKEVADATGGSFFTAESSNELHNVYKDIQTRVGFDIEQREILRFFIGFAILALFLAVAASMIWNARFL